MVLEIKNFKYDGKGPDVYFYVGKKGTEIKNANIDGIRLPYPENSLQQVRRPPLHLLPQTLSACASHGVQGHRNLGRKNVGGKHVEAALNVEAKSPQQRYQHPRQAQHLHPRQAQRRLPHHRLRTVVVHGTNAAAPTLQGPRAACKATPAP